MRTEMKVKPNFELHHNLYIIVDSNEKKKENNKKTCTFYKWEGGGAHGGDGKNVGDWCSRHGSFILS
jgi:hypothetical protein